MLTAEALSYSVKFLDLFENAVIFCRTGQNALLFSAKTLFLAKDIRGN